LQAVHLLDENKKGKANFFLLDKVKPYAACHQPEGYRSCMDVIEVDPQYRKLAEQLWVQCFYCG
jgi:chromosome segregation protein